MELFLVFVAMFLVFVGCWWFFNEIVPALLAWFFVVILAGLGWLLYVDATAEKISLTRSAWRCTAENTWMQPVMVGKIMTMVPQTSCVEYTRISR